MENDQSQRYWNGELALVAPQFGSVRLARPQSGALVTSYGFERPAMAGQVEDRAAVAEVEHCDWDDPLTRLLLLLEIADRPAWLREIARTAARPSEG